MPLSFADWSLTSSFERPSDGLPPDSSIECTEHENSEEAKQFDHIPLRRRLSITSMSFNTIRPTRRNHKGSSKALQGFFSVHCILSLGRPLRSIKKSERWFSSFEVSSPVWSFVKDRSVAKMSAISAGDFGKRRSWISLWYSSWPSSVIAQAWSDSRAPSWQLELHASSARMWFLEWFRDGSSWKVCALSSLTLIFLIPERQALTNTFESV